MLADPERLFERSWRPCHPLRRRHGAGRRWGMIGLLLFLCAIIFSYIWLTDAQRVRRMASSYLSDLLGGEVTIGRANLSVFEGLRLDDITLRVDQSNKPDSIIFHARTFLLRYHPTALLAGHLDATQIIAIDPVVTLVEDPLTRHWNYERMWHGAGLAHRPAPSGSAALELPQIILRDAEVAYLELRNGKTVSVGWYGLEGGLNPTDDPDQYDFQLQSRGQEALGPSVSGIIRTRGGPSVARLQNFTFGADIKSMLMAQPRQWCEWHQLQGRIDVPEMSFDPGTNGAAPSFRAELALTDVELAVHPQEWMSRQQNQRVQWFHDFLNKAQARDWLSIPWADALRRLSTPEPLHLRQVSGIMLFTDKGIQLQGITGKVENNWFSVDGAIDGYSPDAPASLVLSSIPGHDLEIPELSPDYLASLPKDAQDIVEHLHPRGQCGVWLQVQRKQPGGKPTVAGQIDVHDGQFTFSDFPYPVSGASGRIHIGLDPIAKIDGIRLIDIQAHGPPDGPNADATITLNGFIGPLDGPTGVWLEVRGDNFTNEPAILAALPPDARKAFELFDPAGDGRLPTFRAGFASHIHRSIGFHKHWDIATDVNFRDAQATLAAFPYPLRQVSGQLQIRDDHLNVVGVSLRRGDETIDADGVVSWKTPETADSTAPTGPDLHLTARNVPIDDDVLNALPPKERSWLRTANVSGSLDIDGHIFPPQSSSTLRSDRHGSDIDYLFDATLHDATARPRGPDAALTGVAGHMRLTPNQWVFSDFSGHRGDCAVTARATVDWIAGQPRIALSAAADDLQLDPSLYQMLPTAARQGWDAVHPEGSVNGTFTFNSATDTAPQALELKIVPRNLAVTPAAFPYRLENLHGAVSVQPHKIAFADLTAKHGNADLLISGNGELGQRPAWNFRISARQLDVDDQFVRAAPDALAGILKSANVRGKVDVELSKLAYWPVGQSPDPAATSGADADFAAKITLAGLSADIGLPADDVDGSIDLAGLIRDGKLHRLAARCSADTLTLAGRPASNLSLLVAKSTDDPVLEISHLQARFADGDVAGDGQYAFPDSGPDRYQLNLVLRDADVRQITSPGDRKLQGRLTASLQMSGDRDDPASRRGHGDVVVYGEHMYNIPIMLGLLQITNLALPVASPFTQISTRYTLDGRKVIFEHIELKSKDMTMSGSGDLDFDLGSVSLWLVTNNRALIALPLVGPLIDGANEELLKIHIRGTIDQPKVSASSFDTITTTVDQVLHGDQEK